MKLDIIKGVVDVFVSMGVGTIVGNVIKMTADPDAGKIKKIAVAVGSAAISGMIVSHVSDYTDKKIDDAAETIAKFRGIGKAIQESVEDLDLDIEEAAIEAQSDAARFSVITNNYEKDFVSFENSLVLLHNEELDTTENLREMFRLQEQKKLAAYEARSLSARAEKVIKSSTYGQKTETAEEPGQIAPSPDFIDEREDKLNTSKE